MPAPLPPTIVIFAPKGRRPLALPLTAGQVVVVNDASGLLPNGWEAALQENSSTGVARVIQGGEIVSQEAIQLVGFDTLLPDQPVREFLSTFCADTEGIIREFELSEVVNLSCAYLPPAVSRQIALLQAFSSERGIIILNDPFLPFNGRWRESFAAFIVEQASLGGTAVVCCNVGFTPKTWTSLPSVKMLDVAGLVPLPPESRSSAQSHGTPVNQTPATISTRQINENNAAYYAPGIPLPIPASAIRVYKEVKDWIFEPLANVSRFLRTWSGIVVAVSVSFLLGTMGFLLVPNLPQAHTLLRQISQKFDYKWQDVLPEAKKTPSPQSPSKDDSNGKGVENSESPNIAMSHEQSIQHTTEHDKSITPIEALPQPLPVTFPWREGTIDFVPAWFESSSPATGGGTDTVTIEAYQSQYVGLRETREGLLPFGSAFTPYLSFTCPPFHECTAWTRNLQNLHTPIEIQPPAQTYSHDETNITPEDATEPPVLTE